MADDLTALPVTRLARLTFPEGRDDWLIEGLWANEAVGCIGGIPKQGKTWLALEMALAVASGQPCLGRFPVKNPGPVLVFCAEDGPQTVQRRVAGLAKVRGVDFARLAVGWIDAATILLDDPVHDPLVRRHLPDTRCADLVTASRLDELDSRPLINV